MLFLNTVSILFFQATVANLRNGLNHDGTLIQFYEITSRPLTGFYLLFLTCFSQSIYLYLDEEYASVPTAFGLQLRTFFVENIVSDSAPELSQSTIAYRHLSESYMSSVDDAGLVC